jgi:DNA-binding response OmpR family regulator
MAAPLLLVVDDLPEIGLLIAHLGQGSGWSVLSRASLADAWSCLEQVWPDLVLLDAHLRGEEGLDLCRQARRTEGLAGLPIALLGRWSLPEDVLAAFEAGVDFFVDKDLLGQPAAWQERLSDLLTWRQAPREHPLARWRGQQAGKELCRDWRRRLHLALHHSALQSIDAEIVRLLLQRAVAPAHQAEGIVSADGRSLILDQLSADTSAADVLPLFDGLAEQVWRLLGSAACTPFWEELQRVFCGIS